MLRVFSLLIFLGSCVCQITYTGYVYDNLCLASTSGVAVDGTNVKTEAHLHSAGCMTVSSCKASGYVLLKSMADGTYSVAYNLSSSSWPYVITWLSSLPPSRKNLAVTVTGSLDSSGAIVLASQSSITDAQVSYTGYLYDNLCWDMPSGVAVDGTLVKTQAHLHTVGCMLIPACLTSGFSLLKQTANSTGNGYTYSILVGLSRNSTTQSIINSFLNTQKSVRQTQVLVQAMGYLDTSGNLVLSSLMDAYSQPTTAPMMATTPKPSAAPALSVGHPNSAGFILAVIFITISPMHFM